MTTTKHETEIAVDPDVPLVRITREFDAPPAKVFRAHTDPELFAQWTGPDSTSTRVDEWDCRTGGSYRFVSVVGDDLRLAGAGGHDGFPPCGGGSSSGMARRTSSRRR